MASISNDDDYRKRHGLLHKSWVAGPVLGEGSYGAPKVWLKQDEHGRVVDRVAIKDTKVPRYFSVTHNDESGRVFRRPMEVIAPTMLQNLPGGNNVVRLRNWRQDPSIEMLRLYTEFCPNGNLEDLIKDYAGRYQLTSATQAVGAPEAFCWHVFSCLTTVGLLMERGAVHREDLPEKAWYTIVHGDMKPANIFLGANQGHDWQGYPTTKLGDWGLAQWYASGHSSMGEGLLTDYRYSPPEMREPAKGLLEGLTSAHLFPARRTTQTNVWAVGLQIWSLMQLQNGDTTMDENRRDWRRRQNPTPFRHGAVMMYSGQLRDLVMRCLKYLPHERPTFQEIFDEILEDNHDPRKAVVDQLREAPPDDPRFQLISRKERYPLRSMLYDELRKDINIYTTEVMAPPSPPSPKTAARRDSIDDTNGQGSRIIFPPDPPRKPTVPEQAQQRRKILNAWQEAEAKQEIRARKASETRYMMSKMNLQNLQNHQADKGKGPSLAPPEWSPLTPHAFDPAPGAKRKAGSEVPMESWQAEQPNMPTRPVKAARRKGRSKEDSVGPGASDHGDYRGW